MGWTPIPGTVLFNNPAFITAPGGRTRSASNVHCTIFRHISRDVYVRLTSAIKGKGIAHICRTLTGGGLIESHGGLTRNFNGSDVSEADFAVFSGSGYHPR
jgi:hypothetical protein